MATIVRLVIRNLIINAIKLTPSGGNILLKSQVEDQFVNLIIEDKTGPYCPDHYRQLLCDLASPKIHSIYRWESSK